MKVTVDRFEGEFAVIIFPDGKCISVDKRLCMDAKEGDVLKIELDKKETMETKARIEDKFNRLKKTISDEDIS